MIGQCNDGIIVRCIDMHNWQFLKGHARKKSSDEKKAQLIVKLQEFPK